MPFTIEEKRKIQDALNSRGVSETCPLCNSGKLAISNYISWLPVYEPIVENGERKLERVGDLPCFTIVCLHCGHTYLFAVSELGLWDDFIGTD